MTPFPLTRLRQFCLIVLLALIAPALAQAANFVVSTDADSGAGSLRQAILDSNSPAAGVHTITFSAAFPVRGLILLDSNLPQILSQSLVIMGESQRPRINGQSLRTLFSVSSGTTVLELSDLTLMDALAPEHGACIDSGSGTSVGKLTVKRVTFSNCKASGSSLIKGGAIYWNRSSGSVGVSDSRFLNNSVAATASDGQASGGALYTNADIFARGNLFQDNSALSMPGGGANGGAIAVSGTDQFSLIAEVTFLFNRASPGSALFGFGGAIYFDCDACSMQIGESYLRGNSANYGGGVYVRKTSSGTTDAYLTLSNSTFYNNKALDEGAAVYTGYKAGLFATNNTFYDGDASAGAHLGFASTAEVGFFRANLLAPTYAGTACSGTPTVTNTGFVSSNLFVDTSCPPDLAIAALPNSPLGPIAVDEQVGLIGVVHFSGSAGFLVRG